MPPFDQVEPNDLSITSLNTVDIIDFDIWQNNKQGVWHHDRIDHNASTNFSDILTYFTCFILTVI